MGENGPLKECNFFSVKQKLNVFRKGFIVLMTKNYKPSMKNVQSLLDFNKNKNVCQWGKCPPV